MDPGLHQRIYEFLESKGLRKTSQRDAIIEAAFSTTEHYTADDLIVMAKKVDPSVSRATVYRTLPLLVESGMLREMDFGPRPQVLRSKLRGSSEPQPPDLPRLLEDHRVRGCPHGHAGKSA